MDRIFIALGALLGGLGVGAGAFAAHGLKARLSPDLLTIFETGARYQLIHALAIVAVGLVLTRTPSPVLAASGWLFIIGIVIFSGSLYILALTGVRWLGAITPIGGLAMIAGWVSLAWGAFMGR